MSAYSGCVQPRPISPSALLLIYLCLIHLTLSLSLSAIVCSSPVATFDPDSISMETLPSLLASLLPPAPYPPVEANPEM